MQRLEQFPFITICKWAIIISIPVWLALTGVRLVASEAFLRLEYNKPNFPADTFGFTQEERLAYAPPALQYLSNNQGIEFLGDLTFPDGSPMYNERELHHMADVQKVAVIAFRIQFVLSVLMLVVVGLLAYPMTTRKALKQALLYGASLTLAIIVALLVLAFTSWDVFFEQFHQLFFAAGTWRFEYSDTLIRLFPEQFWFDAAFAIGIFTAGGAISLLILAGFWQYKTKTAAAQHQSTATVGDVD